MSMNCWSKDFHYEYFSKVVNKITNQQNAAVKAIHISLCVFFVTSQAWIFEKNALVWVFEFFSLRSYFHVSSFFWWLLYINIHVLYIGNLSEHTFLHIFVQLVALSDLIYFLSLPIVSCPFAGGIFYHSRHIMKMNRRKKKCCILCFGDLVSVSNRVNSEACSYTILFIAMTAGVILT